MLGGRTGSGTHARTDRPGTARASTIPKSQKTGCGYETIAPFVEFARATVGARYALCGAGDRTQGDTSLGGVERRRLVHGAVEADLAGPVQTGHVHHAYPVGRRLVDERGAGSLPERQWCTTPGAPRPHLQR